jgi:ADP-ribosylglycohydrolase
MINMGGYSNIEFKDWIVSDDTILHIAVARSLLRTNGFGNIENIVQKMIE